MNDLTAAISMLGTVLAVALFVQLGCGDQLMLECNFDSDCGADQYCIDAQCRTGCSDDGDCGSGTYCGPYQREDQADPVRICMSPDQGDEGCQTDQECREKFDDPNARCGLHDQCVLETNADDGQHAQTNDQDGANAAQNDDEVPDSEDDSWILVVEQLGPDGLPVTDEDDYDSEDDQDDEQTDEQTDDDSVRDVRVGAVIVRDDADSLIGHGQTLSVVGPDQHESTDGELTYPLAEEGVCVEQPETAEHTSLGGPGGRAYIELVEDDDSTGLADHAATLEIVADGPECPIGGLLEGDEQFGEYRAFVCEGGEPQPDLEDCESEFPGPHSGHADLDVAFSD